MLKRTVLFTYGLYTEESLSAGDAAERGTLDGEWRRPNDDGCEGAPPYVYDLDCVDVDDEEDTERESLILGITSELESLGYGNDWWPMAEDRPMGAAMEIYPDFATEHLDGEVVAGERRQALFVYGDDGWHSWEARTVSRLLDAGQLGEGLLPKERAQFMILDLWLLCPFTEGPCPEHAYTKGIGGGRFQLASACVFVDWVFAHADRTGASVDALSDALDLVWRWPSVCNLPHEPVTA